MSLCTKKFVLICSIWLDFEHEISLDYANQRYELETYQGDLFRSVSQWPYF